jgi:SAM-dependent methyltransferase
MRVTLFKLLDALSRTVPFPEPIYEFGSFRVPGQEHLPDVRDYFSGKRFVGCDLRPGPGVEEMQDLHALSLPNDSIGTAVLFDTIEHVRDPWTAMRELHRCLKPGGMVFMTSVWYFPIHAYPDDYFRFTASGFLTLFEPFDSPVVEMCGLKRLPHTVVGIASKGPMEAGVEDSIRREIAAWKRRGSRSWKETVQELTPPFLLIPAYDLFLKTMKIVHPGRHHGHRH